MKAHASYAFQVEIHSLLPDERYYLPQETGNYSVAGFRSVNFEIIGFVDCNGLLVLDH